MRCLTVATLLCPTLLCLPLAASARDFVYRGYLESDLRLSLPGKPAPPGEDEVRFVRVDNTARLTMRVGTGNVQGFFDVALIYRGLYDDLGLDDIETRGALDPFDIESDALYIQVSDFLVRGLELKAGRQILEWGAADKFNPTGVINPYDLEDPIKFGERVPNEMLVLSYTAPWHVANEEETLTIFDELTFTAVAVPVFRPGQLPASAGLVFTDPDLFVQFVDSPLLGEFVDLQKAFIDAGGNFAYDPTIETPSFALENVQYAGKVGMTLVGVDVSAMYYRGYSDVLQARSVNADLSRIAVGIGTATVCGPRAPSTCDAFIRDAGLLDLNNLDGLRNLLTGTEGTTVAGDVPVSIRLGYPKIQVVGFDAATSLEFLDGLGLWAEAALYFHDAQTLTLEAHGETTEETLIDEGSFWKVAAGTDYSLFSWWYLNVQYLHGFVDEFGADNQDDYVVAGSDFKFFDNQLVLRLFGIFNLQDQSFVAYPRLMTSFWPNTQLDLGALLLEGKDDSKFGTAATGQSRVFLIGRYSF